jgi:hypothetical protein
MALGHGPTIVTSGLICCLDASNIKSYSGTGTTINDISGKGAHGTLNGSVAWVNGGAASYFNFAAASNSNYIGSSLSQTYLDMTIVFMPDLTYSGQANIVGLIGSGTPSSNTDDSLRFITNGSSWNLIGRNPGDQNDWAYPSGTTYYVNGQGGSSGALVSGWNVFGGYRTNQSSFNSGNSFPYFLGSSAYTGRSFQGRIAVALLYNRQLSASEQTQNFNAFRGRFGL